jgi:hypothetical protein
VLTGDVEPAFGQAERLVDAARLTIGGSEAIVATGASRLGLRVGLCGVVGDTVSTASTVGAAVRTSRSPWAASAPSAPSFVTTTPARSANRGRERVRRRVPGFDTRRRPARAIARDRERLRRSRRGPWAAWTPSRRFTPRVWHPAERGVDLDG